MNRKIIFGSQPPMVRNFCSKTIFESKTAHEISHLRMLRSDYEKRLISHEARRKGGLEIVKKNTRILESN